MPKRFPVIQDFDASDISAVGSAMRAVKGSVDIMTGNTQRGKRGGVAALTYATDVDPQGTGASLEQGDVWVNTATEAVSVWLGTKWKVLG